MKLYDQAFGGDNNLNRDLWDKTLLSILSSQTFEMHGESHLGMDVWAI